MKTFSEKLQEALSSGTLMAGDQAALSQVSDTLGRLEASTAAMKALPEQAVADLEAMVHDETDLTKLAQWLVGFANRVLDVYLQGR
ncbi:MAG TPA: hypothetical protein PKG77_19525 [Phycisphaerae bacterium]|nr:hypothetical protein [Phycisphaerae bacterium]HQL75969.1 hypothetical protein [Phycisphaerae bacterium]